VGIAGQPSVRHAVGLQGIQRRKAELQGMKAEHIGYRTV
jgi:hypothetical protein